MITFVKSKEIIISQFLCMYMNKLLREIPNVAPIILNYKF